MKKRGISLFLATIMVMNIIIGSIPTKVEAEENVDGTQVHLQATDLKLVEGKKEKLEYSLEDVNEENLELQWISEDKNIATVKDGEVTAILPGKTTIKLETKDNKVINEYNVEVLKSSIIPHITQLSEEEKYDFILEPGKNYEITNNSKSELKIQNTSGRGSNFNIVQYKEDGSVGALFKNSSGTMVLDSGMKLRISVVGNDTVECSIPKIQSEDMVIKEVEIPALGEYKIEPNENIQITNKSQQNIEIVNNSWAYGPYDYVQYNSDKSIKNFVLDTYRNIRLEAEERIKIHAYKEVNLCFPYEYNELIEINKETEEPLHKFKLGTDKNYEIKNVSNKNIDIPNNSGAYTRFDAIHYNEDKTIKSFNIDTYGHIKLSKGESYKVKVYGSDPTFWMPKEHKNEFTITEINQEPLYKFKLEPNRSYEIKNTIDKEIKMPNSSGYYLRYDSVYYNEDKSVKKFDKYGYGDIVLRKGEYLKLRTYENEINFWLPQEYKEYPKIKEVNEEPLYKFDIEVNKNYKLYNYSNEEITIKNNAGYYNRYDLIHYKVDGSYKYSIDSFGDIKLNPGEYAIVSCSENNDVKIECFTTKDAFESGLMIVNFEEDTNDIFELLPKINLNITKVVSKNKNETENTKIKDKISQYNINIYNETQEKEIRNLQERNGYLILPSNSTKKGDKLKITINSKNNSTLTKEVITTMDDSNNAKVEVEIEELGYLKIKHASINNSDLIKMLVFDDKGEIIEYVTNNNKPIITKYFSDGNYTVVLLKAKGELWKVEQLKDLEDKGFKENTDYIKYSFNIKKGVIEELNIGDIPAADEDLLSFFNRDNTRLLLDTSNVVQGGNIEVRLEYSFKEQYTQGNTTNKSIRISLDDGTTFINNSLILDNEKVEYKHNGNRLDIPIEKSEGVIKFYISVEDATQVLKAESLFTFNKTNVKETIGVVDIEADYITINGPQEVSSKNVTVHGITKPNTNVSVYCEKTKLGEVISSKNGKWKLNTSLPSSYSSLNYNLVAKTDENTSKERVSNEIKIKYKEGSIELENIVMYYRTMSQTKKLDLTSAFSEGDRPHYTFLPGNKFTFKVKMKNQQNIDKIYVTSERNGEIKRLEAEYDKVSDTWIASGFFDPNDTNYVPGILNVVYVPTIESIMEPELLDEWKNADVRVNENDGKIEYFITLADKEKTQVKCTIREKSNYKKSDKEDDIKLSEDEKQLIVDVATDDSIVELGLEVIGSNTLKDLVDGAGNISGKFENIKQTLEIIGQASKWGELNEIERKDLATNVFENVTASIASSGTNPFMDIFFNKQKEVTKEVTKNLIDLLDGVWEDIKEDWKDWNPLDKWREKKAAKEGAKTNPRIDPSGYVYEAVHSNRVEGVKATVYYKDEKGQAVKWDAEEYDQINPQMTDKDGRYEWFVPEGMWQVKYEKSGYGTTYSDWLPVPPPQTEVNIGIVSKDKPGIELFNVYKDKFEVTFNKYMDTTTINTSSIKLTDSKGNNVPITIEAIESDRTDDNKLVAKKFTLKTSTAINLSGEYKLAVNNTAKTYSGINNDKDITYTAKYKGSPTEINVKSSYYCKYGETINILININETTNASEFEAIAISDMNDIAQVVNEKVKFDSKGVANIKVNGKLSGEATITIKIPGTDLEANVKINVLLPTEVNIPEESNDAPTIDSKDVVIKLGDKFDPKKYATANDKEDGDLTSKIEVVSNTVNISKPGDYKVTYKVVDSKGESATKTINVKVNNVFIEFTVNNISSKSTTITGKGVSGSTVQAYVGSTKIGNTATVNSAGNYSITIPIQKANTNIIVKMSKSGYETAQKTIKVIQIASGAKKSLTKDIYKYDAGKGKYLTYINGKGYSQFVYLNKSGNYAFTPSSWMVAAGLNVSMPTSNNGYTMTVDNNYISLHNDAKSLLDKIKANKLSKQEIKSELNNLENNQGTTKGALKAAPKKTLTTDIYKYDAGKGKFVTYINGKGYSQFVYLNKSGNYAFTPSSWMVAAGLKVEMPTKGNGYTMKITNPYINRYNDTIKEIEDYM